MKTLLTTTLEFITPCFCAGADQKIAEIRVSSIRGELRWWFRCLGGTKDQEAAVFGSAAGNSGRASSILVRIGELTKTDKLHSPTFRSPNDASSYHHYFLTAPNKNLGEHSRMWDIPPNAETKTIGKVRLESQITPGSTFSLSIVQTRKILTGDSSECEKLLDQTISCFKHYGALGYRLTRGFGGWFDQSECLNASDVKTQWEHLEKLGFSFHLANIAQDWTVAFNQIETKLKGNEVTGTGMRLKSKHPSSKPSPLGFSIDNDRQASAVRFRVLKVLTKKGDPVYCLLTFQAPDSVLGKLTLKQSSVTRINLE